MKPSRALFLRGYNWQRSAFDYGASDGSKGLYGALYRYAYF